MLFTGREYLPFFDYDQNALKEDDTFLNEAVLLV